MSLRVAAAVLLMLVLHVDAATGAAQAQVRRCTTADGGTVFTDRQCADIDATESVPRNAAAAAGGRYRGGCMRNLQDLIYELTAAIDSRDPNRLAGIYHWPGMSHRTGYAVLQRLDDIVQRPLINITALRPAAPVVALEQPGVSPTLVGDDGYAQPALDRRPTALRIDQTLRDGITPTRTVFGLRRHLGCWWVTL